MNGATNGPLHGIRVLDLSRVLAGPICGRALADLGAEVIKIEPPAGDTTRFSVPRRGAISGYFAQQNAGKRNVSIDLTEPRGRTLLVDLAAAADIVVENFRPGVASRLGVGYEDVAAANPGIIYASLTGYGQSGPWAGRAAYAPVIHAEAGYTARNHNHQVVTEGHSVFVDDTSSHADVYTGLIGLSGILAALYERTQSGLGQQVDVAMLDTMVFVNEHVQEDLAPDDTSAAIPSIGAGWSTLVEAGDGSRLTIAGEPTMNGNFENYAQMIGSDAWRADPRYETVAGRVEAIREMRDDIRAWARSQPDAAAVISAAEGVGLAVGEIRTIDALTVAEHAVARGIFTEVDDRRGGTWTVPQAPFRYSRSNAAVAGPPAWRGEHNRSVVAEWLGRNDDELDELETGGVLSARPPRSPGG